MRVALLGPVRVQADDGTPIDGLWGAEPPADAANALQSLVSRLRRVLGGAGTITSASGGYTLDAEVDAHRFDPNRFTRPSAWIAKVMKSSSCVETDSSGGT